MTIKGKKLLVTGAAGMLAADLVPALTAAGASLVLTDYTSGRREGFSWDAFDITDESLVEQFTSKSAPEWIINCAAYTKVDDAEKQYGAAFAVNSNGPLYLARAAAKIGARLLHLSSDYVFGGDIVHGERRKPFVEGDAVKPCGIYGFSKHFGDLFIQQTLPENHLIVRTSWLHGIYGPNFVDTMLRISQERSEVKIVNDQFGSPTWTGWLAKVLVQLIATNAHGLVHASSRGDISWFDMAQEIFRQSGSMIRVLPQTTVELNRAAPRPAYSTLDVSKLERTLGQDCPTWQECITSHLAQAKEEGRR